jgi:hypothetical protein
MMCCPTRGTQEQTQRHRDRHKQTNIYVYIHTHSTHTLAIPHAHTHHPDMLAMLYKLVSVLGLVFQSLGVHTAHPHIHNTSY